MHSRRLPVYLLLDCSESMAGTGIEEINRGVQTLVAELLKNPMALETAFLSVITFSRYAKQDVPLTELAAFRVPKLAVRPGTSFGAAIRLLTNCLKREVTVTTHSQKGDYKPLVFLFTDGQPTDDWEAAVEQLRGTNQPKIANIYAIGCGPDVDSQILHGVTDIVLKMDGMSTEAWRRVFIWLSASVSSASVKFNSGDANSPISMPSLPDSLVYVPPGSEAVETEPRQVFLQAICQRSKQAYLMRFARQGARRTYAAMCSHPIESLGDDASDLLPPINSTLLDGCPGCPYCENDVAATCPCGAMFCSASQHHGAITCPKCQSRLVSAGSGAFDIRRSNG